MDVPASIQPGVGYLKQKSGHSVVLVERQLLPYRGINSSFISYNGLYMLVCEATKSSVCRS